MGTDERIFKVELLSRVEGEGRFRLVVRDGQVAGYAVMRKLADNGTANDWYWYEGFGDNVLAEGRSPAGCTGCHSGAPRDFIFTRVE